MKTCDHWILYAEALNSKEEGVATAMGHAEAAAAVRAPGASEGAMHAAMYPSCTGDKSPLEQRASVHVNPPKF